MTKDPYNFLFIVSDDLFSYRRFLQSDKVWGHAPFGIEVPLPGLRALEQRSVNFDRAYCSLPVCGPSRAAVMSGYSPAHTGVLENDVDWKDVLRPEHLWTYQIRRQGYYMGTVGKIFHGYTAQPDGVYSSLYDSERFDISFTPKRPYTDRGGMFGRGWDGDEDQYYDYMVASTACEFLETYDEDRPFWFEVGFHHPHVPFSNPNRVFDMVDMDQIIMPEDWKLGWDLLPFTQEFWSGNAFSTHPTEWTDEQTDYWRKTVRNYIASIIFLDEQLARVVQALDASPYSENTIITFYSDHGYHLADKGHWHKFTLWEECCAAPMMISVPGVKPRVEERPVSMMDLGPTCLDYAGATIADHHKGISLRRCLETGEMDERLIPTFWFGSVSAAVDNYRITVLQDGSAEFYDIQADPWQIRNLANEHPEFNRYRSELLKLSSEWGMDIVEEKAIVSSGTPFGSLLGVTDEVEQISNRFIAIGDVQIRARTPGYNRMWGTTTQGETAFEIPQHVSVFTLMGDTLGAALRIRGNLRDNHVNLGVMHEKRAELDFGDGDDSNTAMHGRVVAYGGRGNDRLRAGHWGGHLFGGPGDDTLQGSSGRDIMLGGPGNDVIGGGRGDDVLVSGTGSSRMFGGPGNDTLVVDGGNNVLVGGPGNNKFVIHRTGHIQTIRDFDGDVIDLSDWKELDEIKVRQVGPHVLIEAAHELVVVHRSNVDAVKAAITFEHDNHAEWLLRASNHSSFNDRSWLFEKELGPKPDMSDQPDADLET